MTSSLCFKSSIFYVLVDLQKAVFNTANGTMQMILSLAVSVVVMQRLHLTPGVYPGPVL